MGAGIGGALTEGDYLVDPCLKLADGRRACADHGGGSNNWVTIYHPDNHPDSDGFPAFAVVMTTSPAATARLTAEDGAPFTAPLHQLPGGERRAGVVMVDRDLGLPACADLREPSRPTMAFLDASGADLPCQD